MKDIKNFLIKREQSQACLSFAKREKSRLLAKLMITLVALLAVTTGAWADDLTLSDVVAAVGNSEFVISSSDKVKVDGGVLKHINSWSSDEARDLTYDTSDGKYHLKFGEFDNDWYITIDNDNFITGFWVDEQPYKEYSGKSQYALSLPASAPSGPEVAWNKASKTGTFTMPGGNVELEPEYYPQATVTTGGVTAATGVQATTDAELVTIDKSKITGASGMKYFVGTTDAAPAYNATGWSDKVPTAADITTPGPIYVWYYPVGKDDGDNSSSDGNICTTPIEVNIAPAPTYAVTFADGTPESDKWTASPNTGVSKGTTVTVTYTGTKKVLGVKAEKKAESLITSPEVGQVIGSDGKNYAYGSLPTGVTAVAKICYVSGSNGLALALTDLSESYMNWSTAQTTCAAHTPAITGGTWKLATKDEWSNMISAAGSYTALRNGFSSVGGTNMKEDNPYWSSTEDGSDKAWSYFFSYGRWGGNNKNLVGYVRACLAF